MNIEAIIHYNKPKETYYHLLGCHQSSTMEQINKEYKIRALQFHPDKNSDYEAHYKFHLLKKAKDILTNEHSRKSYDLWLASSICIPFEHYHSNRTLPTMHWANPKPGNLKIKGPTHTGQGSAGSDNKKCGSHSV